MGWYFRKSVGMGPLRMNFSKSGVSYSFGVKGARINTGRRGTYVNFGSNGIYYRKKIGGSNSEPNYPQSPEQPHEHFIGSQAHTITSGPVEQITDTDSQNFVNELNDKASKKSYLIWVGFPLMFLFMLFFFNYISSEVRKDEKWNYFIKINPSFTDINIRDSPSEEGKVIGKAYAHEKFDFIDSIDGWNQIKYVATDTVSAYVSNKLTLLDSTVTETKVITNYDEHPTSLISIFIIGIAACIVLCSYLWRLDKKRLTMEINYDMDDKIKGVYGQFLEYFKEGTKSNRIWQVIHSRGTNDWKRNAGAGTLVNRIKLNGIFLDKKPTLFFKTNIQIPNVSLKGTDMYFFPERLVIRKNGQFAAVFYKNLSLQIDDSRFIEEDAVMHDSLVVDYTWKYLNKNGTPDRRFNNNRQLPICLYSNYTFTSQTGVYETICTSKKGAFDNFTYFIKSIGDLQRKMNLN